MSQVIDAVFENGVFKPLQNVQVKDHERVEIRIVSLDDWQSRFNRIIDKIQQKAKQYAPEEIESDIAEAVKAARREKLDR